jgi:hypothetical protein
MKMIAGPAGASKKAGTPRGVPNWEELSLLLVLSLVVIDRQLMLAD